MSSPSGAGTPSHRHPSRGHLISSGITTRGKATSHIRHQPPVSGKERPPRQPETSLPSRPPGSAQVLSGMLGAADLICCTAPAKIVRRKKRKQFQKVELKVRMDCEGCERKVRKALEGMKGVSSVEVDPKQSKVTVSGHVEAAEAVRRLRRRAGKTAEPWPYVPYDVVPHPYVPGAYDKKAPPGHVRNVLDDPDVGPLARASSTEERYTSAFSDENPNSCAVM